MKLLLGDDHVMFLEALREGLVRRGHEVVGSYDQLDHLVDAVAVERPDLCVLDVNFSGRSVLEAATTIRGRDPGIALVLLAGCAPPDVWRAFERGLVDGIVNKLCDISVLDRSLRRVRRGEKVVERFLRPAPTSIAPDRTLLTEREQAVVQLLAEGASNAEIAAELQVSEQSARTLTRAVLRKLGVTSRNKAARLAVDRSDDLEHVGLRAWR
ncbi:response regulator transcription factor [Nocardioides rubriscoriae]|uniref:response regulator transcription factor n=1 Tax=Nocardioides rubriscoriae TaxID=642762 RepID=UPI0011DFE68E|nr:response regulator transcription factor [Nocardioides rubriscoriae]